MSKAKTDDARAARRESERFRKARNNFFDRGVVICSNSEAEMFVLIRRKGKCYRLITSDSLMQLSEAEIIATLAMSRTPEDIIRRRTKQKGRRAPTLSSNHPVSTPVDRRRPSPPRMHRASGIDDSAGLGVGVDGKEYRAVHALVPRGNINDCAP